MPWTTATLTEKTRREGALTLRIVYGRDDSSETATEHLEFRTVPDLGALAQSGLARLNAILVADRQITIGPIALPQPPDPPPQDAKDQAAFVAAAQALKEVTLKFKVGLSTQQDVDAASVAMKAAFKPGYEHLLLMVGL